jgi:RimJ/RimL family protein N-acetyltransferase
LTIRMVIPEMLSPGGPHLNADLLSWCSAHLGPGASFQVGSVAMGVASGSELLAVAAFDNFRRGPSGRPLSIECSISAASPRWATRGTIRAILHYPFCQLGVQRVTALVQETNGRSIKMLNKLGFVREGYVRASAEDGTGIYVTGMLREEARKWLGDQIDG